AVGDDNAWNMAFIFDNIGMSYSAMGDLDQAIENINRARAVAEKAGMKPRVAAALTVLGDLEAKRGHLDAGRKFYEQSLTVARQIRDVSVETKALLGMAEVALAKGDAAAALEQADESAQLARQVAELGQVVPALSLSGRALVALGRDDEARGAFAEAITDVETMRDLVAGGDVERETFFAREIEPYHEMIRLLVRQNKPEEALAMAERASARVLLDITSTARADESAVLTADEQHNQRELGLKLTAAQQELVRQRGAAKPEAVATAKDEQNLHEAEEARDDFDTVLKAAHPELRRTAPPSPLQSLATLAPLLRGGKSALLRYVITDEEAYLFVVRAGKNGSPELRIFSLGKNRAALARLTNDFRSRLASRSIAWEKPARELYDLLLRPAGLDLRALDSVVIVPDGPLWEIPFQALESEADHPLLADCAVRYAPSLTLLERWPQSAPARRDSPELLALINPSLGTESKESMFAPAALMGDDWQPLPQVEKQASALRKIYPPPNGEILVGAQARESEFKKVAGQAGLLHFATHGVLNDRAPLFSYLLLSQENRAPGEDGRLETREIMQMKLRARLAILDGCETARGEVTAGEGVIGLSWGFFVAGCPATIVSQWKVESTSSTTLMIELHRQLHAGVDNAEALRRASLALLKDERYRHPFYWAPFVLVGANL
ncbi:MAG TPA: CHAT domain-containing tetratricopeptide repeat protein, partial [Chthoniobacterales bacterium]